MRFGRGFIILLSLLLAGLILLAWHEEPKQGTTLSLEISSGSSKEKITCWQSDSGESYFFLPSYGELDEARFRVSGKGTLALDGTVLTDGMSCGGLVLGKPYNLTNGAGDSMGSVTFVRSGNVAAIYLDVASGSMDYIHEDLDHSESGRIRVYKADGSPDYSGRVKSIGGRGQSTWAAAKKPYSMTLSDRADLLGMGKAKKWILLANAYDSSHLRNKIVLDASAAVGPPYTPECRWVDLYLNGEYAGLYLLTERNEVDSQRVDIAGDGSFLVSKDWETRFISRNRTYFTTDSHAALRILYSDISTEELKSTWQSAENAILAEDGIDPVTGKSWQELVDMDSWVRRFLIEEVFANIDAGIRSQAFFRDGADGKICAGPVWDYDLALGNRYAWPKPSANMAFASIEGIWGSEWYAKLYLKEVFYSCLTSVYETEFRPLLDYIVGEQIDRYAEEISAAAAMNRLRWGTGDAALEAKWMKRYLSERIEFLDSLWLKNEHYCEVTVFLEDGVRLRYYVCPGEVMPELRDYISTPFVTYDGWYNKKTEEPFDLSQPIWEDTDIYLKYTQNQQAAEEEYATEEASILRYAPLAAFMVLGVLIVAVDIYRSRKEGRHGRTKTGQLSS